MDEKLRQAEAEAEAEIRNPKSEIRNPEFATGAVKAVDKVAFWSAPAERGVPTSRDFGRRGRPTTPDAARAKAFSLIEMLVVIAVIGILASMIFPVTKAVSRAKTKSRTKAELEQVVTAIEIYKSKRGQYPPDNHFQNTGLLNPYINPLYYELVGTTNNGVYYQPSDGRPAVNTAAIDSALHPGYVGGVSGFVNSTTGENVEEGPRVVHCLMGTLGANQVGQIAGGFNVLVCSVPLPAGLPLRLWPNLAGNPAPYPGSAQLNAGSTGGPWYCAWRYNSSNPTNNPSTYDLWVDVIINGRTNRFSNWSRDPVIVGSP
jgi:prepilin-type N-terminal cleavage/methylation domain-containing protein